MARLLDKLEVTTHKYFFPSPSLKYICRALKVRYFLFSIFYFLFSNITILHAQQKFTISGYVKDVSSGESLIATTIGVKGTSNGTTSNDYGFYSITLMEGPHHLVFSYLGYITIDTLLELKEDLRLNISLMSEARMIEEIVVSAEDTKDENVKSSQMGKFDLQMDKIKTLPVLFGEQDILKTLQLLPGVQSGGEGSTGFYVRGGGADQNLILLDEATVYNASHLFGFFSVFNSDAVLNAVLYKEGMPAAYGGRISSVLDINMKEGNMKEFHGSGGIGIIASRLMLEGPIKKDKCSFIVTGRRTYADVVARPWIEKSDFAGSGYYFYDLNAKINYKFSDKDRLFLSGYFGRDVFTFNEEYIKISIPWGNATTTLRWNHLFSNKLFMNASAIYNAYNFELQATQSFFEVRLRSGIRDYNTKIDFSYYPSLRHQVQFGANYTYHVFQPQSISGKSGDVEFNPDGVDKKYAHEGAVYLQDQWDVSDKIQVSTGLRFSLFNHVGPYIITEYDAFTHAPIDSTVYAKGEQVKTYTGLEPRLMARFAINDRSSLKASFTINNQYVHLVSNNGTTLPTDIWVPSTLRVKPQIGYQYALGYFRNFRDNMFETSVEVYYKDMHNQIEYQEGYTPAPNEELEDRFVYGNGDSYGVELFVNKKEGIITGWVGYTLSFTNRVFQDLNGGEKFPYRYDRRHNLSIVASYHLNERWNFGITYVYNTGIAYTIPESKYFIEGNLITEYGDVNSWRLPAYHRLDISANLESKKKKRFQNGWSFSIYNVYNRKNPYFIYNEYNGVFLIDPEVTIQAKQVSLFPIIPSVTWNFKF